MAFELYLRQKDWQVVFDERIRVDDGLVQMLVENFPGEWKAPKVFDLEVDESRGDVLRRCAEFLVAF